MEINWFIVFDVALFIGFIIFLFRLIHKRKEDVTIQKLVSIGKFPIIFIAMLRTTWGLNLMDRMAKKYGNFIRFYGYVSIGIAMMAMLAGIALMGLVVFSMFTNPQNAAIAPALPFINLPGIGYISFLQWIIIIGFIATIHEFAHGVVARAFNINVKKSGIAIISLLLPIIPAAFVEPDDKQMKLKKNEAAFYSIIAAGPVINLLAGIVFWAVLVFALVPLQGTITEPIGFSVDPTEDGTPASVAGLHKDFIITHIDSVEVTDATTFLTYLKDWDGESSVALDAYNRTSEAPQTFTLTPEVPTDGRVNKGYIGGFVYNEQDYTVSTSVQAGFEGIFALIRNLFLFNIFVGILNMLPIAIADGGQIFLRLTGGLEKTKNGKLNTGGRLTALFTILMIAIILIGMGIWLYFSLTGGWG